ncbi:hypothetical protein GCM10011409_46090 [Lentibacillus populi]|uniref:Uncharacterized protein n=1 Tax=Lentibacillus populi TaxID=1827502 RepID=A0A9W5U278_9BACI|nr:hypothetical protein [Lentibacillus populi]GGB63816.1 hypothetical protein GCM10011409_46090 [Lentibacillus populi]
MPDAQIKKLERRIKDLQKNRQEWRDKYYYEKKRNEQLQVNHSELEQLEIKNARLQIEINNRDRKLKAIKKALKDVEV